MTKPIQKKKPHDPALAINPDGTINVATLALGLANFHEQKGAGHGDAHEGKAKITPDGPGRHKFDISFVYVETDPSIPSA